MCTYLNVKKMRFNEKKILPTHTSSFSFPHSIIQGVANLAVPFVY